MATRGCSPWITSEFDESTPWCSPRNTSTGPDAIVRTEQLKFLLLRQIAQMDGPESSVRHVGPDRHRVFSVAVPWLEVRAGRIGGAATWQRRFDHLAGRRDDRDVQPCHLDLVAWLGDAVLAFRVELRIDLLQKIVGGGRRLHIRSVVDERADWHACRELRHAAVVITMPMGRDERVDSGEPGRFRCSDDPFSIAHRTRSRVSGIDQQRLARPATRRALNCRLRRRSRICRAFWRNRSVRTGDAAVSATAMRATSHRRIAHAPSRLFGAVCLSHLAFFLLALTRMGNSHGPSQSWLRTVAVRGVARDSAVRASLRRGSGRFVDQSGQRHHRQRVAAEDRGLRRVRRWRRDARSNR